MSDAIFDQLVETVVACDRGTLRPAVAVGQVQGLLRQAAVGAVAGTVAGTAAGTVAGTVAGTTTGTAPGTAPGITADAIAIRPEIDTTTRLPASPAAASSATTAGPTALAIAGVTTGAVDTTAVVGSIPPSAASAAQLSAELFATFLTFLPAHIRELAVRQQQPL